MDASRFPLLPLLLDRVPAAVTSLLATEGVPFEMHDPARPRARFVLFDSRRGRPRLWNGQRGIDLADMRRWVPDELLRGAEQPRLAPHAFQIGKQRVVEHVAQVHRARLRQVLMGAIRQAVERAGGVWLRFAPFPFPYRSAFTLRVDHTRYDRGSFDAVLARTDPWREACTQFLAASSLEGQADAIARLQGYDLAGHVAPSAKSPAARTSQAEVEREIERLNTLGITVDGCSAEGLRSDPNTVIALKRYGIRYNCQARWTYDDLPYQTGDAPLWQVPVHPISLGQAWAVDQAAGDQRRTNVEDETNYACELIRRRYTAGESVVLAAPAAGCWEDQLGVLDRVLETVSGCAAMWPVTMSRFLDWWEFRNAARLQLHQRGDELVMIVDGHLGAWRMAVELWRGDRVALVPVDTPVVRFQPESLAFERRRLAPVAVPDPVRSRWPLWSLLRPPIDWQRVMPPEPLEEISWRGWTKRVLRNTADELSTRNDEPESTIILPPADPDHQQPHRVDRGRAGAPPPRGSSSHPNKRKRRPQ